MGMNLARSSLQSVLEGFGHKKEKNKTPNVHRQVDDSFINSMPSEFTHALLELGILSISQSSTDLASSEITFTTAETQEKVVDYLITAYLFGFGMEAPLIPSDFTYFFKQLATRSKSRYAQDLNYDPTNHHDDIESVRKELSAYDMGLIWTENLIPLHRKGLIIWGSTDGKYIGFSQYEGIYKEILAMQGEIETLEGNGLTELVENGEIEPSEAQFWQEIAAKEEELNKEVLRMCEESPKWAENLTAIDRRIDAVLASINALLSLCRIAADTDEEREQYQELSEEDMEELRDLFRTLETLDIDPSNPTLSKLDVLKLFRNNPLRFGARYTALEAYLNVKNLNI